MNNTEKLWLQVDPVALTADGGQYGEIQIDDTSIFKVKQRVTLKADATTNADLEVKRIVSSTLLWVGPRGGPIKAYSDVTAFTIANNASIQAPEQPRSSISQEELNRAMYEEEPIMAQRVILVGSDGATASSSSPLPVSSSASNSTSELIMSGYIIPAITDPIQIPGPKRTFQVFGSTSAGTGASVVKIEASLDPDLDNWVTIGTVTLTLGTTPTTDGFAMDAPWQWFRVEVVSISGTNAEVSALAGY